MSNYTIDQAQRDIAQLRFLLTSLQNNAQLGAAVIGNANIGTLTLTNPLPLASGGTGVAAASNSALLTALGAAALASPSFTGTVTMPDGSTWGSSGPTIGSTKTLTGPDGSTWTSAGISPAGWSTLSLTTVTGSGNGVNGFRYKLVTASLLLLEWDLATNSVGNNVTIATLPSGFRPSKNHNFACATYGASTTLTTGANPHFVVNTSGTIVTGGFPAVAFEVCGTAVIGMDT